MTNKEAIIHIETLRTVTKDIPKYSGVAIDKAVDMAIRALEQDPVLDKIRAEVLELDDVEYDFDGYYKAVTDALHIIDKYKAEIGGKG